MTWRETLQVCACSQCVFVQQQLLVNGRFGAVFKLENRTVGWKTSYWQMQSPGEGVALWGHHTSLS